jgi:hypothetical protein
LGQCLRDGPSNSLCGTGDDRNFSFERHHNSFDNNE